MSLYKLARQVQSKGRNGDTMLVHMTPGEVQGLQALAMKHGGSLTINPETGLPEANILKAVLPIAAGIALGPAGLGMSSAMAGLTVGGVTAVATRNLGQGIMAGLGAYGGAGLSGSLMSSGATALAPEAIAGGLGVQGAATGAGSQAAMLAQQNAGFGLEGIESIRNAASGATGFNPATVSALPTTGASIQEGFKQAASNPGAFFKQNMFPIGAAATTLLAGANPPAQATIPPAQQGTIQPYTYNQTRNPQFGVVPGASYFNQTFTPGTPYTAKEGGIIQLASGGQPNGPVERMSMMNQEPGMYPQGMIASTQYATPSQMPASMEVIKSDYDTPINAYTGLQNMASGGIVALAEGGIPPVEQLKLAPNLGKYSQPAPAVNPSVIAYNQILADRAANEYVVQPPPLTMLPGGGERATPADTSKIISEYYLRNLGRKPDEPGLEYWTKQKTDAGLSLADINKAISASPEGQLFGFYRDILGRRPDEEGAKYWQSQIDTGAMTPEQVRAAIAGSAEAQAMPAAATTEAPRTLGGYTYDPVKGFTKVKGLEPEITDFGFNLSDPNFQSYLQRQYQDYQQSLQGGMGGKAGGLMPNDLGYAGGGGISDLGGYSDGGRLLKGPGDGVSDSIPAQIGARQPARLADGEFVVPARIVSELGNGSTDAGARKLYSMMDRIQKKRRKSVGKDKVAVDTKPESALPA